MSEGAGFLKDICEHPEDDTPRLVYADFLEERQEPGDEDRAQFIRMQCSLASGFDCTALDRPSLTPKRAAELKAQADLLLEKHQDAWEQPLYELGVTDVSWSRGFPEYAAISAEAFLNRGTALFAQAPITEANITHLSPRQVQALADCPHLTRLTSLRLSDYWIGDRTAQVLAASPHLARLTELRLEGNQIGDAGADALAGSKYMGQLTRLNLRFNDIGEAGAQALVGSPNLRNLTRLNLRNNLIGDQQLDQIQRTMEARRQGRKPQGQGRGA